MGVAGGVARGVAGGQYKEEKKLKRITCICDLILMKMIGPYNMYNNST